MNYFVQVRFHVKVLENIHKCLSLPIGISKTVAQILCFFFFFKVLTMSLLLPHSLPFSAFRETDS